MSRSQPKLSRRTLLRGAAGIGLALPFLEAMLDGRKAQASGPTPKKRLVVWYTSTGTVNARWRPSTTGTDYTASPILAPLDTENLRKRLTILSGIRMSAAELLGGNAHNKGMTSVLTGRAFTDIETTEFGDVGWGADISFDQEMGKRLADPTQLKTCETGVIAFGGGPIQYMSYAAGGGQGAVVPAESDPRKVFQRLFANIPDSAAAAAELEKVVKQRKSMLDLVQTDFGRLNGKLGKVDQQRLDQHLTLLRELEDRIKVGDFCAKPDEPTVGDDDIHKNENIPELGKLQMDMMALGLSCDVTRVGTIQWSGAQSVFDFKNIIPTAPWDQLSCPEGVDTCTGGINTAEHTISHISRGTANGGIPSDITQPQQTAMDCLTAISHWYAQQLAYFGDQLAGHADVDGSSLLDNTCVLCVTEVAEGPTHAFTDMPIVLLGGAGGAIKPGHFDYENNRSMNDLFVTVGQALGASDMTSFGDPSLVTGPLSEILA